MTLQERLAASLAKSRSASPKTVVEEGSAATSPALSTAEVSGTESNGIVKTNGPVSPVRGESPQLPASPLQKEAPPVIDTSDIPSRSETPDIPVPPEEETQPHPPTEELHPILDIPLPDESIEVPPRTSSVRLSSSSIPADTDPATADLISQLRADLETCETRRIEEAQQSSERIASLEQKLKLLEDITMERNKEMAADNAADTMEKKLADREEKIALLIDEGIPFLISLT
jgi:TATA element modulatory factor